MKLDQKDWVTVIFAALLAAAGLFVEDTLFSGICLFLFGSLVSYFILTRGDIHRAYRALLATAVVILVSSAVYYISNINFQKEMRRTYGRIYPGNVPVEDERCSPGSDILLFSGLNRFQVTEFPYTFLYVDGDPIISLGREGDAI
jgi:hypothetical protein